MKRTTKPRKCEQCGKVFVPRLPGKCCSLKCSDEYYKDCAKLPPPRGSI